MPSGNRLKADAKAELVSRFWASTFLMLSNCFRIRFIRFELGLNDPLGCFGYLEVSTELMPIFLGDVR